jgi:hypothetical protein
LSCSEEGNVVKEKRRVKRGERRTKMESLPRLMTVIRGVMVVRVWV